MRMLLCLLIASVAAPAWAKWLTVGETTNSTQSIDPTTIRKDGDLRRVWELHDLKKRDQDGVMSRRMLFEYDCKKERFRLLSFSLHAEPGAKGKVLLSDDESDKWNNSEPGTATASVLQFLCTAPPIGVKWMKVADSDSANHYIDPVTIRRDGQFRGVWVVIDVKQRGKDGVMSWRALEEYDCKEGRYKIFSPTGYSEPRAGGDALRLGNSSDKWTNIAPNTPAETKRKLVCAK
jgi:hypothetical protein